MRLMRRTFIKSAAAGVAALASSPTAWAAANPRAGNASGATARDMFELNCSRFFDWRAYLEPSELAYAERCMELIGTRWSEPVTGSLTYSLFTFSHRITKIGINSARAGFGSIRHAEALRPAVAEMVRRRGVSPASLAHFDSVAGVAWDGQSDGFKLYSVVDLGRLEDAELKALAATVDEPHYTTGLVSHSLRNGKVVEKRVYVALKIPLGRYVLADPSTIINTNYMVTNMRGIVPQTDVRKPFDASLLGAEASQLSSVYETTLGASLDTYSIGPKVESLTVYFG